jgi:hypothetical protein
MFLGILLVMTTTSQLMHVNTPHWQALWAASWLKGHIDVGSLLPGWTYLFEAVYADNVHGVQYSFEGLVLLAAVAPDGRELFAGNAALGQLGAQLGVMVAPCLEGPWGELLGRPHTGAAKAEGLLQKQQQQQSGVKERSLPASEGWVLQAPDGLRCKLVTDAYQKGRVAVAHLHPVTVWDRVSCGGRSRAELIAGAPARFRADVQGMLDALDEGFCCVQRELQAQLQQAAAVKWGWDGDVMLVDWESEGQLMEMLDDLAAEHVERRAEKLEQVQALLADHRLHARWGTSAPATAHGKSDAGSVSCSSGVLMGGARAGSSDVSQLNGSMEARSAAWEGRTTWLPGDDHGSLSGFELASRPAFHTALRYVLKKRSAEAHSMYFDRCNLQQQQQQQQQQYQSFKPAPATPLLRGLILDCIRPGQDGTLPGYTPLPGIAQTHAKGWKNGPAVGRMAHMASAQRSVASALSDEGLVAAVLQLEGTRLVKAQLVSKAWQRLLVGNQRYSAKVALAREKTLEAQREREEVFSQWDDYDYDDTVYEHRHCYDDWDGPSGTVQSD